MKDQHVVHSTEGRVCAGEISFDVVDGVIFNVKFEGGCKGNTQGVAARAEGVLAEDVVRRCRGIDCHGGNSCPDELAKAVEKYLAQQESGE